MTRHERIGRSVEEWVATHPFLLFGLASLIFVLLAIRLEVGADTPAAIIVRVVIWPIYAGASIAVLIVKALFGTSTFSTLAVFVMRCLMVPLSMAPYLMLDWIYNRMRRRRLARRSVPSAPSA